MLQLLLSNADPMASRRQVYGGYRRLSDNIKSPPVFSPHSTQDRLNRLIFCRCVTGHFSTTISLKLSGGGNIFFFKEQCQASVGHHADQ